MPSNLKQRIISSIIMIPAVLLPLVLGGFFWFALLAVVSAVAIYEWWRLTRPFALWQALAGIPYILTTTICFWKMRQTSFESDDIYAIFTLLIIIGIISFIDISAYAFGKTIGGRKLAPSISPGKTWAGLIGAMASTAILTGYIATHISHGMEIYAFAGAGAALAVLAQGGDLFESWLKRRAGVKDSGTLIPGHGGVLDRIDGYLTTIPFIWLVVFYL